MTSLLVLLASSLASPSRFSIMCHTLLGLLQAGLLRSPLRLRVGRLSPPFILSARVSAYSVVSFHGFSLASFFILFIYHHIYHLSYPYDENSDDDPTSSPFPHRHHHHRYHHYHHHPHSSPSSSASLSSLFFSTFLMRPQYPS